MMVITLAIFSFNAQATIFNAGNYKITADIVVNTTDTTRDDTYGIGKIVSIQSVDTFQTYWTSGLDGQYINFNFDGYLIDPELSSLNDFVTQGGLGQVNFWLNDSDLFGAVDDWNTTVDNQAAGELLIQAIESGTTTGSDFGTGYRSNGFLDVIGGSGFDILNTNSIDNPSPIFEDLLADDSDFGTDMSFNITGTGFNNALYDYTGTSNSLGVATVPVPSAVWLMISSIGLLSVSRRK
jgi:hypothetical protein